MKHRFFKLIPSLVILYSVFLFGSAEAGISGRPREIRVDTLCMAAFKEIAREQPLSRLWYFTVPYFRRSIGRAMTRVFADHPNFFEYPPVRAKEVIEVALEKEWKGIWTLPKRMALVGGFGSLMVGVPGTVSYLHSTAPNWIFTTATMVTSVLSGYFFLPLGYAWLNRVTAWMQKKSLNIWKDARIGSPWIDCYALVSIYQRDIIAQTTFARLNMFHLAEIKNLLIRAAVIEERLRKRLPPAVRLESAGSSNPEEDLLAGLEGYENVVQLRNQSIKKLGDVIMAFYENYGHLALDTATLSRYIHTNFTDGLVFPESYRKQLLTYIDNWYRDNDFRLEDHLRPLPAAFRRVQFDRLVWAFTEPMDLNRYLATDQQIDALSDPHESIKKHLYRATALAEVLASGVQTLPEPNRRKFQEMLYANLAAAASLRLSQGTSLRRYEDHTAELAVVFAELFPGDLEQQISEIIENHVKTTTQTQRDRYRELFLQWLFVPPNFIQRAS